MFIIIMCALTDIMDIARRIRHGLHDGCYSKLQDWLLERHKSEITDSVKGIAVSAGTLDRI